MAAADPEYIALLNRLLDLLTDSHSLLKTKIKESEDRLDKVESQLTRVR